jgi:hypothetical protein
MAYIGSSIKVSTGVILELKILKHVHTQNELLSDDNQNSHGNVPCEPQNKLKGSHAILAFHLPFLFFFSFLAFLSALSFDFSALPLALTVGFFGSADAAPGLSLV